VDGHARIAVAHDAGGRSWCDPRPSPAPVPRAPVHGCSRCAGHLHPRARGWGTLALTVPDSSTPRRRLLRAWEP
jgi:hypothetical protein